MADQYEKDIESVIRYLKIHDPENATREYAAKLLKDWEAGVESMADNNPELLEKLQQELKENRHSG